MKNKNKHRGIKILVYLASLFVVWLAIFKMLKNNTENVEGETEKSEMDSEELQEIKKNETNNYWKKRRYIKVPNRTYEEEF